MLAQLLFLTSFSHYSPFHSAPRHIPYFKAIPLNLRRKKILTEFHSQKRMASTANQTFCVQPHSHNGVDLRNETDTTSPILDFGPLHRAVIVCRPSASIKSPYVADIIVLSDGEEPPKLDVTSTTVLSRGGRRTLDLARTDLRRSETKTHVAHVPGLDCVGMLTPGAIVYCTANASHPKVKLHLRSAADKNRFFFYDF